MWPNWLVIINICLVRKREWFDGELMSSFLSTLSSIKVHPRVIGTYIIISPVTVIEDERISYFREVFLHKRRTQINKKILCVQKWKIAVKFSIHYYVFKIPLITIYLDDLCTCLKYWLTFQKQQWHFVCNEHKLFCDKIYRREEILCTSQNHHVIVRSMSQGGNFQNMFMEKELESFIYIYNQAFS